MAEIILTKDYLNSIFQYVDGRLMRNGKVLGSSYGHKYERVHLLGKKHYSHRLIFLMHHGFMPDYVDHIDNNPLNNRIENLRIANKIQNGQNAKLSKSNKSGVKGVCWYKAYGKWAAECWVNKKKRHLGYFERIEDAAFAVKSFREQNHGKFARHS